MPQLIIGIVVLFLVFYLVLAVIGAGIWVAALALLTLPAGAAAYGCMFTAENLYCRKRVKELHERGKLCDILQLYFKDSMLHWNLDATAITDFSGHGTLRLLLFAVGFITVWIGLFILGKVGAFEIDLGTSMTGWNTGMVYKINEIVAYVIGSGAIGCALVLLPRSFHQAMTTQAGIHIQRNKLHLDKATHQYQTAIALYESMLDSVLETGDVGLLKLLDKRHVALHSPNLADYLRNEDWIQFDETITGIIEDLEKIKFAAENYPSQDESESEANTSNANPNDLSEEDALCRLGFKRGESPSASEIKRAYHKIAKEFHPDVNSDKSLEEKLKLVSEAYARLKELGRV